MLDSILIAAVGVLGLIGGLCVLAWIVYVPVCMRAFGESHLAPAAGGEASSVGEECELVSRDGLLLRGTYLRAASAPRHGVLAFCHELGGSRRSGIRYAEGLCQRGYDVFLFDFRGHGDSQHASGRGPLPWLTEAELDDARAVIDYLCSRPDADPAGIGILGISKGGAAALCAAAGDRRVKAIITDGAFPTRALQIHYIRRYMQVYTRLSFLLSRLPNVALAALAAWTRMFVGWQRRGRFVDVESFSSRVEQPVLMIHGNQDRFVPRSVALALRGCLAGPSKLWIVARAKHNGAVVVAEREYHDRAARFFRRYLSHPPTRARRPRRRRLARRAG